MVKILLITNTLLVAIHFFSQASGLMNQGLVGRVVGVVTNFILVITATLGLFSFPRQLERGIILVFLAVVSYSFHLIIASYYLDAVCFDCTP